MIRVAFQGVPGAYGEEAVALAFGEEAEAVPSRTFRAVGEAVVAGEVDWGVIPLENSIVGPVPGAGEVLETLDLHLEHEVVVPVHHCLLALPDTSLERIERVHSHPVALAQCLDFFEAHPAMRPVHAFDTAGAAREIAEAKDRSAAALASRRAARLYGLKILAANVEDRPDNRTRFAVVTAPGRGTPCPERLIIRS